MLISASRALKEILKVVKGTKVLVVTDTHTKAVGDAFFEGVKKLGGSPEMYFIDEAIRPIKEIPEALLGLIPGKEVGVTVFKGFPQETPFRISLIKTLMKTLKRLGHGPGITAGMLTEGPMNIDYAELVRNAESLINAFEGAVSARITAPAGTDITLNIEERRFKTDVVIKEGSWGNLPAGEIWCAF
ncbi:MAG: leucyl aminopeptidase, partial [Deltaproteobacteria bacterium]|nr:leucyl aminopeptidase [Deltaproteobacteria bacterium]